MEFLAIAGLYTLAGLFLLGAYVATDAFRPVLLRRLLTAARRLLDL